MGDIRDRLQAAIATIEEFADGKFELHLRPPTTEAKVQEAEREFGHRLPEDLRELYLLHDGQAQLLSDARLFLEEPFATLDRALAAWRDLRDFYEVERGKPPVQQPWPAESPELRSVEHDILWFPFGVLEDEVKSAYWVDLNPIEGRPIGQVIEEGPWAHPPTYVGPSVLALLETLAKHIRLGDMVVTSEFGFKTWGFGPQRAGFTGANAYLREGDEGYPSFLDDLPPEWSAYLRTKSPLYSRLFLAAAQRADPAVVKDIPLRESLLVRADMIARPPRSAMALGDVSDLRSVVLRGAESLHGLEAAPLYSVVLEDSPRISYRGFESSKVTLDLIGDVASPDVDLPNVSVLRRTIEDSHGWGSLRRFPSLTSAALRLATHVDPNDGDWSYLAGLSHLELRGGAIGSLAFLQQLTGLRYLRLLSPTGLRLAGLPAPVSLALSFVDAPVPPDIDTLLTLDVPANLSGPIDWFRATEGRMKPGVWTGVYDGGDMSTWADLTALNWRERRDVMTARGLDGF